MNRTLRAACFAGLALLFVPLVAHADTEKAETGAVFAASKSTRILDAANPAGKVLGSPPSGTRLVYRRVMVGADGKTTWFYVAPPGRPAGWVVAAETSPTKPGNPPIAKIIKPIDSGLATDSPTAAQTAAARGLSDSAKQYAEKKPGLKAVADQFMTLETTVETLFSDPHDESDGSYPDVTVPERQKKAAAFKMTVKE